MNGRVFQQNQDVYLSAAAGGAANEFPAKITAESFLGDVTLYELSLNGLKVRGKTSRVEAGLEPGREVFVRLPEAKIKIFPK